MEELWHTIIMEGVRIRTQAVRYQGQWFRLSVAHAIRGGNQLPGNLRSVSRRQQPGRVDTVKLIRGEKGDVPIKGGS